LYSSRQIAAKAVPRRSNESATDSRSGVSVVRES
jgi:hypothetical protein